MVRGLSDYQITTMFDDCKGWLERMYGDDLKYEPRWMDFGLDKIHFSKTSRRGHFSENGLSRGNGDKMIWIGLRDIEHYNSYCKKTKLGLLPPLGGFDFNEKDKGFGRTLIHELTHFIQYLQGRTYSEVETTENEILWLLDQKPTLHKYFIPYSVRKIQEDNLKKDRSDVMKSDKRWDYQQEVLKSVKEVKTLLRKKFKNEYKCLHRETN